MNPELPLIDDTPIWDAMLSQYNASAIAVALKLEIFEALDKKPDTVEALTRRLGYSLPGMTALLGMLRILKLLDRHGDQYQLNNLSRSYMLCNSPYFWGPFFSRMEERQPNFSAILENIRDGKTHEARPAADGWEAGQMSPEVAKTVTDFMHCHSITSAVGLAHSCDFSNAKKLLDIGGGSGCYASALANQYPELHCTVMELEPVCEIAAGYIERAGVSDRVDTQTVDMFRESWPEGYDTHFFANVFHDWSIETCIELARKSYAALPSGGRICLQEMLLDETGDGPAAAVAFSFMMTWGTKGQQFSLSGLRKILEQAGFHDVQAQRSYGYYSLVTAKKR